MKDIRKQESGKNKGRSSALAGNGKLRKRMRKRTRKDCISRYPDKERNIGMSHIRILHKVKITNGTMFILRNLMERKVRMNNKGTNGRTWRGIIRIVMGMEKLDAIDKHHHGHKQQC
jgi:hypothetical protein